MQEDADKLTFTEINFKTEANVDFPSAGIPRGVGLKNLQTGISGVGCF